MAIAGIAGWAGRSLRHYAMPKRPEVGELAPVNELWAQRLLHYWSTIINPHQEQIQARLRELGPSAGQARSDAERAYDWLRCGVTAAELERSFFHWAKPADAWERGLLSLALDMGNDLGIAVPSTHDESRFAFGRSAIYRQYRAGENATAASSSVVDLANVDNPEAVLAKMDWMTRSALGIDRDENWQDLDPHRQNLVREIAEENAIVLEGTTDGAPLVSVRAGVIEEVDEDGLLVRLSGISYDGPDEYEFIDEGALVEVDRSKATKGSAVT
ncbi:MAG: hypothetical protein KC561_20615, partial [Myxococcales bacterium]|nr:hypothetical protein [Myxococcales bacterium]